MSLTAGNAKAQTYFSFANTLGSGVIQQNRLVRNTVTLRETAKFLNDKIDVSASVNLSDQSIWNRPTNGLYSNPLTGVYLHPVGIDRNIYQRQIMNILIRQEIFMTSLHLLLMRTFNKTLIG